MKMPHYIPLLIFSAAVWHFVFFRLAPRFGLVKENFNKCPIVASYGIVAFVWIAAMVLSLSAAGLAMWNDAKLYLPAMAAMWVLGILDDTLGSREVGGFSGHFKKLIRERKLTTGAVKALGGGIVGLVAGWMISDGKISGFIPAALLIPLSANLLNLFDLRPGRTLALFFLGIGLTYIVAGGHITAGRVVAVIAIVALLFGIWDSRGRAMMGDSGSNMLGAALGITITANTGIAFQWCAIAVIVWIHLYSEKRSISQLIERNRVLRSIDRRLGVR